MSTNIIVKIRNLIRQVEAKYYVLRWRVDLPMLQGVRGQSGFFNWALRERNIQVRLYLNVVLKS